jgi:hypothetical protein
MPIHLKAKWLKLAGILVLPTMALTLMAQQITSLSVSGQPGQAQVVQVQGRNYVDINGLTRILNGSISFSGNQIVLTLSGSNGNGGGSDSSATTPPPPQGLSKDFLNAGIEAMSQVREWHAALKTAIERSYPISNDWIAPLRRQAQQALRLAEVAASTPDDKNAYQLLANAFNMMAKLSDKYLGMASNVSYIDPNSLSNDPTEQRLITCGHSLVSMASSGQFVDDGSCH